MLTNSRVKVDGELKDYHIIRFYSVIDIGAKKIDNIDKIDEINNLLLNINEIIPIAKKQKPNNNLVTEYL